ncbi:hypothetical protein [Flindersiella endophytica]
MKVAITGHRGLPPGTSQLVDAAIRAELRRCETDDLTGVSCLADGADQLFARAVLELGGRLEVVVPAADYRAVLPADCHADYDELLTSAQEVFRLSHRSSTSEAFMDASRLMLGYVDHLLAVWDGKPARGFGGTADVIQLAGDLGIEVTVLWPPGATRE